MKRKLVTMVMAVSLSSCLLSGCTIGNTEFVLDLNTVGRNDVFSINGEKCTKEEAKLYLCNYQNLYGNEYGINLWQYDFGEQEPEETLEYYVKEVTLAELTNVMCMSQLAEEQGLMLTEEEQKSLAEAANTYFESLNKEERAYIGLDKGELEKCYTKYALAQKLYLSLTQGVNEEVSDDEARVVRIQQIYVTSASAAQIVKEKLESGSDFSSLASTYNEEENAEVYVSRGTLPEEVESVVFHLGNQERSDMIAVDNGYYFVKCLDKYVEDQTEENKQKIIVQRRKEQFENVLGTFIEKSDFELNEDVWNGMELDISGAIKTDSFFEVYDRYFTE